MPQTQGKKRKDPLTVQCENSVNSSNVAGSNQLLKIGSSSITNCGKSRKRKHCDAVRFSDLESEFEDCDLEDAAALETKLRKVARRNSLTHDEMMKLLHKFVKNEHILALVTLQAENELVKEKQENEEQRAIIITETPSVPKLTRSKARELNKTHIKKISSLKDKEPEPEIVALIEDDLHSDEEDEEYVFKEEDFVSDDDPNTTVSDLESNPRTPKTPANLFEKSPIKLSNDGCFKVPLRKNSEELSEELRIAARTRSKLCLEQTTIEDLQSEFVPPDVEEPSETTDFQTIDEDWMQFLNDFTKPLNASLVADDDDLINDPEYVAADKIPVDAEELRDVNISKKELSELVAELYDDLMTEGLLMESVDLETPRKFVQSFQEDKLNINTSPERSENSLNVSRQLNFEKKQENLQQFQEAQIESTTISTSNRTESQQISETQSACNTITSTNNQNDFTFQPDIVSRPFPHKKQANNDYNIHSNNMALIPIAESDDNAASYHNNSIISSSTLNTELELIAVPIPGQPNCFQLAKVTTNPENKMNATDPLQKTGTHDTFKNETSLKSLRDSKPYEINYTCNYISVQKHIIAEYINKFKSLHAQDNKISSTTRESEDPGLANSYTGFTQYQYDLMQQQLRIHIQQITQTFVQTYCHPELWKLAPKVKEMLLDLQMKSKANVNFQVWNLEPAVELIHNWQKELDQHTPENTELMNFLHHENIATNHQGRQIPRFHPRILDCYLNSPVFMYPQYLPRMPFSAKPSIIFFSPEEAYLIAMGLEKHLQIIYEKNEKISVKTTPLRVACKRLAKDTLCGKRYRRIWHHILHLQKVDYYNPIKYFFEHNRAPPVYHDPIWTFHNNIVLPPKDRFPELPLVFQTYLQKKNEQPKEKSRRNKKSRKRSTAEVFETFKNSLDFIKEAVGQDFRMPNLIYYPEKSNSTLHSDSDTNATFEENREKFLTKPKTKRKLSQSLTINVNYVYGNGLDIFKTSGSSLASLPSHTTEYSPSHLSQNSVLAKGTEDQLIQKSINARADESHTSDYNSSCNNLPDSTINKTIDSTQNNFNNTDNSVITYVYDWKTKSLQPAYETEQASLNLPLRSSSLVERKKKIKIIKNKKLRGVVNGPFALHKNIKQKASAYRVKRHLKRRCEELITTYSLYLNKVVSKYSDHPLIQHFYCRFKALELYTYLLKGLKIICNNYSMSNSSNNSPNLKRTRNSNSNAEEDNNQSSARQVRKLNRQEENFRHMLLPDTPEEANRKDAIYAFNFYEKVEEAFKTSNKAEDCKKFNDILKSFDPKKDKVSDLYYKLEKLFLPDHPELAQVFLTFLLPSEAAEIGKFFEHFMINNMGTFINKLNIYFNKQPAQIRKIYNCLNDLSEDSNVTMKTVEARIVPLLKGNQFLIDWFMQQFPQSAPPERLYSQPERINLKDQSCNRPGEYIETVTDLIESPTNDSQQQQSCQLRYINGRIFYGSKMLLPAKLSFMAASYKDKIQTNDTSVSTSAIGCVHGIREHGEKRLHAAAMLNSTHGNTIEPPSSDDQDKSEEEDVSKTLVIDTTADEEDSCSSVELCDEANLRAHATRLNPSVYSSTCYSVSHTTSTPNLTANFQTHHATNKKTHLNFHDESKLSPRKHSLASSTSTQSSLTSPLATVVSQSSINLKEKRKSPSKKIKSPLNSSSKNLRTTSATVQPMVVIHEPNSAIQCAKRLKSLIEGEGHQSDCVEEIVDSKDIIRIVARSKQSLRLSETPVPAQICEEVKVERSEDLEFIAENSVLSPSPFPCLRIETDSNEEEASSSKTPPLITQVNDEDCKINIVSSQTTEPEGTTSKTSSDDKSQTLLTSNVAWTRDEDKIILIEMKIGSQNREELYERIYEKLPNRTNIEIMERHQFLMDFLSKLQGK